MFVIGEAVIDEDAGHASFCCDVPACRGACCTIPGARGAPLEVHLPGGLLTIVVPGAGQRVLMTGPARHVFDGSVELP